MQAEVRHILLSWKLEIFNDILHDLVCRWQKCCAKEGEYFEGENVTIDPLFVKGPVEAESSDSSD